MQNTIIVFLIVTIFVMLIVSESKKLTCSSAIGYVLHTIYNWIKSIIPKNEVYYPTGIGYDANGIFCPGTAEMEFEDLGQVLDTLGSISSGESGDLFGAGCIYAAPITGPG